MKIITNRLVRFFTQACAKKGCSERVGWLVISAYCPAHREEMEQRVESLFESKRLAAEEVQRRQRIEEVKTAIREVQSEANV